MAKNQRLIICIDCGGSSTKVIGDAASKTNAGLGLSTTTRKTLVMDSDIIEVPRASCQKIEHDSELGTTNPIRQSWIRVGETTMAVGYLAASRFFGNPQLSELKKNNATYKVLAAVWVLAQNYQLGNQLDLSLACFLPPGEYRDRENFQTQLTKALTEFETPTGIFEVNLIDFNCKPEGAGVFMHHRRKVGSCALSKTVTGVVMLGYRNTSLLPCCFGEMSEFHSKDLGFVQLVKRVQQRTSGYQLDSLGTAIANAGHKLEEAPLRQILKNREITAQSQELNQLKQEIELSRIEYVFGIVNWLKEISPPQMSDVVLCGGTADYLKEDLKSALRQVFGQITLYWHGGVELPDDVAGLGLGNRLIDVWCLWDYFNEILSQKTQKTSSEKRRRSLTQTVVPQTVVEIVEA